MVESSYSLASAKGTARVQPAAPAVRLGLIGVGAIGHEVSQIFRADSALVEIVALTRRTTSDVNVVQWVHCVDDLIATKPQLVIEAAGHSAVAEHVVPILRAGIPVVLASVGALANDGLRREVTQAALVGKTSLILPCGAIGALDYVRTVSHLADLRIRYCSRKPVAAWKDELIVRGLTPEKIDREVVLFEGAARDAALSFPQNLNVAMSLALAGPGIEGVEVRVVADPKATGNTHEIEVESAAGRAVLIFNNLPSADNPKTSALTALSIVHAVREYFGAFDGVR